MATKDLFMKLHLSLTDKVSGALNNISKSSRITSESLKTHQAHLRTLEKDHGLIQKLKREQEALRHSRTSYQQNQIGLLAMKKSGAASAAQIKAQTALVKKSTTAFDQQRKKVLDLRRAANAAGIRNLSNDEKRLAAEIKTTTAEITRQDKALRNLEAAQKRHTQALKVAGAVAGAGMLMRSTGQRGLNIAGRVLSQGLGFDESMAGLQGNLGSQADSGQMKRLREIALDITNKDSAQVADSMKALVAAGMNVDQVISAMPALVNAADASMMDMETTTTSFAGVMKSFGADFNQFNQVTDLLVSASNAGNLSVEQLNEALAGVAPNARVAGISLDQTAAMIASLNRGGINASNASGVLNDVFKNLQAPSTSMVKALNDIGIKNGSAQDIPELLAMISERTAGMSEMAQLETMTSIFGNNNSAVMMQLMNQIKSGGYDNVLKQLSESSGAASSKASVNTDHLNSKANDLKSSLSGLGTLLTEMNKDWLKDLAENVNNVIDKVRNWIKENPGLVGALSKAFIIISAVLFVLGSLATAFAAIVIPLFAAKLGLAMLKFSFGGLLPGIVAATKAMITFGISLLTNPITWIVLGVMALAAGAIWLYKNWDKVGEWFSGLWQTVKTTLDGWWTGTKQWASDLWSSTKTSFTEGIDSLITAVTEWSPLESFKAIFADVLSWFGLDMPESFSDIGGMLMDGLVNGIKNGLATVKDAITNVGSSVVDWFKDKLRINSPSRVFMSVASSIPEGVSKGITDGLPMVEQATLDMAKSAKKNAPKVDGASLNAGNGALSIDYRRPLSGSSTAQSAPLSIGGDTLHFHFSGVVADAQGLVALIQTELQKFEREKTARLRSAYSDL